MPTLIPCPQCGREMFRDKFAWYCLHCYKEVSLDDGRERLRAIDPQQADEDEMMTRKAERERGG